MIHYTKYAEEKFEILNKHKVFITKEQVEDCLELPDEAGKRGKHFYAQKDGLKVIYEKEGKINRILTFFPIKL